MELDSDTLWQCMHVCKAWHDFAKPHFFAVVQVKHERREQFCAFASAQPDLAKCIKEVRFVGRFIRECDITVAVLSEFLT